MNIITLVYTIMFFFGIYFLLFFILSYLKNRKELFDYPKPKKFPTISFLTAAYNEEASIADTINALLKVKYPKGRKEIIIINDGSKDKTASIIKKFVEKHKEIKLIDKKNSGKADSLNQGIKIAKGELIAVVDADSYPNEDSLYKMVGYFEDEKVAAVTSRVLVKNKKNFLERFQDVDYITIAWGRKMMDFIGCVYVTNGPLSVYRKNVVQKLGGFNTKNITEDIELTWHILSAGYKTKMSYSTEVYTTVPSSFKQWIKQRIRWNLGGLQTIYKYRKSFFKGKNLFGYFVINYVSLAFFLALIGLILLLRFIYLNSVLYLSLLPYIFSGYNPFAALNFYFPVTLLLIFGLIFLALSLIQYKISLRGPDMKSKSILTILIFIFIYRSLYTIPFVITFYKILKGDISWYTK